MAKKSKSKKSEAEKTLAIANALKNRMRRLARHAAKHPNDACAKVCLKLNS